MNIEDYVPDNFHPDKFHPLKCLWLHNRKAELLVYYLKQVTPGDVKSFRKINPVTSASEQLQRETGMTIEDIYEYTSIGGYIHEFLEMLSMTPEELQKHIDSYESDPEPLDPQDQAEVDDLCDTIAEQIKNKQQMRDEFNQIINDNFDDT